jgi:hypothetical protein
LGSKAGARNATEWPVGIVFVETKRVPEDVHLEPADHPRSQRVDILELPGHVRAQAQILVLVKVQCVLHEQDALALATGTRYRHENPVKGVVCRKIVE